MRTNPVLAAICWNALLIGPYTPASPLWIFFSLPTQSTSTKLSLMSADETEKVMQHATDCAEGECSLDEVEDLINVLKVQQKELYDRIENVKGMVKTLEVMNKSEERKVDEVRETVRALFRVFQFGDKASGNDYPSLSKPMGWTGEIGDGPKTAYDSLPPKKWKPKA